MEANYLKGLLLMFPGPSATARRLQASGVVVLQMQVNLNQIILMLIGAMILVVCSKKNLIQQMF
jgi:hypothetical protein